MSPVPLRRNRDFVLLQLGQGLSTLGSTSSAGTAAAGGGGRGAVPLRGRDACRTEPGRALFGLGRSLPFLADAISYAASILMLTWMRAPFQETRQADPAMLGNQWLSAAIILCAVAPGRTSCSPVCSRSRSSRRR